MMNQLMAYGAANAAVPQTLGVHNFNIPTMSTFQPFNNAGTPRGGRRGGGRGRGGRAMQQGDRRNPRTPFADYTARTGGGGGGIPQFVPATIGSVLPAHNTAGGVLPTRNNAPMYSNIVKKYNNMNACFSCGFDVEDGHTSCMCPIDWRRADHQEAYDRQNAQEYINAGYDPSTKAKHKTQLPAF